MAPTNNKRVITVTTTLPTCKCSGAALKTSVKSIVLKVTKISIMARIKPKSPTRFTIKAFIPAADADFFSNQ